MKDAQCRFIGGAGRAKVFVMCLLVPRENVGSVAVGFVDVQRAFVKETVDDGVDSGVRETQQPKQID